MELKLSGEQVARLQALAEIAGLPVEQYAVQLLSTCLEDDWADADAALAHHDRTGEYVGVEDALTKFEHDVERGLAARGRKSA